MMDEMKKNELNEEELVNVAGGIGYEIKDFLVNSMDRELYASFSEEEKKLVQAQPDRDSRRAKMIEIWKSHTLLPGEFKTL